MHFRPIPADELKRLQDECHPGSFRSGSGRRAGVDIKWYMHLFLSRLSIWIIRAARNPVTVLPDQHMEKPGTSVGHQSDKSQKYYLIFRPIWCRKN
eukprot:286059-Amorphochlora_amoeboformis.AAC.2